MDTLTVSLMLQVMIYLTGLGLRLQATRRDSELNLRNIQNLNQQIFVQQSFPNRQGFVFSVRCTSAESLSSCPNELAFGF